MAKKAPPKKKVNWLAVLSIAGPFFGIASGWISHAWNESKETHERAVAYAIDSTAKAIQDSVRDFWVDKRVRRLEVNAGFREDSE